MQSLSALQLNMLFTFRAMLSMGKSKPWPFALEKMTGTQKMSVAPLKEYFQPLQEWLVKERCSKGYKIGWPGQSGENCTTMPISSIPTKPNRASTSNHFAWLLVSLVTPVSFFVNQMFGSFTFHFPVFNFYYTGNIYYINGRTDR